ncbi:hypothetical protein Tco_0549329 [Tanacetum coccineum]
MRMLTITLIGSSASLAYSIFPESLKTQSCSEFFPLLLPDPQKGGWTDSPQELSIPGISSKRPLSKGIATTMTAKQLEDIHNFKQEGDESLYQAWERYNDLLYKCPTHDINKSSKGPHLDKDWLLNEEVKQLEEVRYREIGRTSPFNGNNGGKFRVGPLGYYTKTDNRLPYGERRQSLEELLTKHQEESVRRSTKMEVWSKKLQENAEINTRNQNASLKNLETVTTREFPFNKVAISV